MKTYARIENGKVAELLATGGDVAQMFHPSLIWVDVTDVDGVAIGWQHVDEGFTAPDAPALADVIAAAVAKIDNDVDAIYGTVIGTRQAEYDLAEREAKTFAADGYPVDDVPASVESWAEAKSWTPDQAADDILATANQWRQAQNLIRANRLARKEDTRKAENPEAVDAVLAQWGAFVTQIKTALGF